MDDWGFAIAFLYSYPGKQYSKPTEIGLEALYEGWDFRYENDRDIKFELDNGVKLVLSHPSRTTELLMTRRKREHLSTTLTISELEKLVDSKSIRITVNEDKFELSPCEYRSLREFFNSIK